MTSSAPATRSPQIIETIVEQHAEEAAFLWLLRDAAVSAPHYDLKDLAELDERVEAHIDGLRIAGDPGWEICAAGLEQEEPGEVFAAGVLALESHNRSRLEQVYSVVQSVPETARGLISAFGWVEPNKLQGTVKALLTERSPLFRRVGIAACAVHRVDPKAALESAIVDADMALRCRALRAAGEVARVDLLSVIRRELRSKDERSRFWAAWSSVLLGHRGDALDLLKATGTSNSPYRDRALQVVLRVMDCAEAQEWLKGLAQHPDWMLHVIIGTSIIGDPNYVPWLIRQMEIPDLARPAGEAFTLITGVDIADEDLEGEWPKGFEAGPTENPEDEDVEMDPDEDLAWPEPKLIQTWWDANKKRFQPARRYLLGQLITEQHCREVLVSGLQRQRKAAALELALLRPETPLFETRAPGFRQQQRLKGRTGT